MGWEKRGQQHFYYRSHKVNGRVIREYLGRGPRAVKAATEDTARQAARNTARREKHEWEALDSQVATLNTLITLLSRTYLVDNGFYHHKRGEWRKRSNDGKHPTEISPEP